MKDRWLAVAGGGDTVRLVPVPAPSTGPDVFVKLQDAEAAVAAERERCAKVCEALAEGARDNSAPGAPYWDEAAAEIRKTPG